MVVMVERESRATDTWKVWCDQSTQSKGMTDQEFASSMQELGTFNTIEEYKTSFAGLLQDKQWLPNKASIRVFQNGVQPLGRGDQS